MSNQKKAVKDNVWHRSPDVVKKFVDSTAAYRFLCEEVESIMRHLCVKLEIQPASISSRTKELSSFVEKIERKAYSKPFEENTDFAGVRVVCLLQNDVDRLAEKIQSAFTVTDSEDKRSLLELNSFGYLAKHFIVELTEATSGERCRALSSLKCELQIRTVLQDAWAVLQHSLIYKSENAAPEEVQRNISRLAALMEIGDYTYAQLVQTIEQRRLFLESQAKTDGLGRVDLFIDSLHTYLKFFDIVAFNDYSPKTRDEQYERGQVERLLGLIQMSNKKSGTPIKKLNDLNKIVLDERVQVESLIEKLGHSVSDFPACHFVVLALALSNDDFFAGVNIPDEWRDAVNDSKNHRKS